MLERDIQSVILKYLKSKGIYSFKVIKANKSGIPDIVCCYKGLFVSLEVKNPGNYNVAEELQEFNINEIIKSGGIALVVDNLEEVKQLFKDIDKGNTKKYKKLIAKEEDLL